jgi:DNA polymerase-3 subunit alpha
MPKFIHLKTYSSYSLSKGAIKIEDLVEFAYEKKLPALCISDDGNLFAALEFAIEASKKNIQPIISAIILVSDIFEDKKIAGKLQLIAKNEQGYKNLLVLVSKSYLHPVENTHAVSLSDVKNFSNGLILLSGGFNNGLIPNTIKQGLTKLAINLARSFGKVFGNDFYLEIQRHSEKDEQELIEQIKQIALETKVALVATNEVCFLEPELFEAHDALTCIANSTFLIEENRPKSNQNYFFKSQDEMQMLFEDIPEAIASTVNIAKKALYFPKMQQPSLPKFKDEEGFDENSEIEKIAILGLKNRLTEEKITDNQEIEAYNARLKFELSVISKMNYSGYFLIVSDFVKFAKLNDIPVGPGRGSGAGSLVAWVLEITEINPIKYGLLFERFLNPDRISMPDFDIDFCQDRRGEIIYYVAKKYGTDKVAHIITFGKLQARAVLRDVGRVLQIPLSQVDKICKMVPFNPIDPVTLEKAVEMDSKLQEAIENDSEIKRLVEIALKLEGLNRHASTHAAGIVIGHKPLIEIVALYKEEESNLPATQFSMKYAELAGLVKFDFLGLKTLTMIKNTCDLIFKNTGKKININHVPLNDEKTFVMLSEGKSSGVFQMESSGMKEVLRKMKPDSLEDIIALISLYRPGPMENIPSYILRKHGKEQPDYILPQLETALKETYGVIIYQEQVMEIAKIVAGYSLAQADILRRAMGKKNKEEMDSQRQQFIFGAINNSITQEKASYLFDLLAKFAGYGFNKSHAACYALIGYHTAYLKANYPNEFLCALMNMDMGDTDKLCFYAQELKNLNIKLLNPSINSSEVNFSTESQNIRYGLKAIKNIGEKAIEEIIEIRKNNGKFKSFHDLLSRINHKHLNKRMLESLTKTGALDELFEKDQNRKKIVENSSLIIKFLQEKDEQKKQISLFSSEKSNQIQLQHFDEFETQEKSHFEAEVFGFYLNNHPVEKYKNQLSALNIKLISGLEEIESGIISLCGIVQKAIHRFSGDRRFSYLYVSDSTGVLEISLFDNQLINNSRDLIESKKPLYFLAEVKRDEGGNRVIAREVKYLEDFINTKKKTIKLEVKSLHELETIKTLLTKKDVSSLKNCELVFNFKVDEVAFEFCEKNTSSISLDAINFLKTKTGAEIIYN